MYTQKYPDQHMEHGVARLEPGVLDLTHRTHRSHSATVHLAQHIQPRPLRATIIYKQCEPR